MFSAVRYAKSTISRHLSRSRHATSFAAEIEDFSVKNEPVLQYLPGSKERQDLEAALKRYKDATTEVPIVVGGERVTTGQVRHQVMPFDHGKKLAKYYWATPEVLKLAIKKSLEAREKWEATPLAERIKIILKAADLVSGKYRMDLNAATMLGQGKTIIQAEIDSAAELADFFRFNAYFAKELCKYQPISENPKVTTNTFRLRGIEGFIAAISPFNFTAIGGNLASAPALMGNAVLWKPSDTAVLSNYLIYQLLEEAGVPPGVINFLPTDGPVFGNTVIPSPDMSGINFTGSVATFRHLWNQTAQNLDNYKNFPRLIGECGGKNYHFVHPSADIATVVAMTLKSAFEYSGQKCSACSRAYIPDILWPKIKEQLVAGVKTLKLGSPLEADTYLTAVIDDKAFDRISGYVEHAKKSSALTIVAGGKCDNSTGYYIEPTIVETTDPKDKIIQEEIFGPVLTVYVYPEKDIKKTLELVNTSTGFALTGSIFAREESFIKEATDYLKMSAGNFYINDKSTGSVVGQQPFGGARLSGTNDKAGGPHYTLRWTSPQVIKRTFVPLPDWTYPYMKN